jgi:DNA invertase Pin-like site-specific DNA recombinase
MKTLINQTNQNYVAYYRCSTQKQGKSGLGLEAQKNIVSNFVSTGTIASEFVEVESGKKKNRVELQKAIQFAKENNCTLVVAKLDRLSRNAAFLFQVMESGIKVKFADMPEANEMQIGIMAVLAQYEARMISERTKQALAAKKAKNPASSSTSTIIEPKEKITSNMTKEKSQKRIENFNQFLSKGREAVSNKAKNHHAEAYNIIKDLQEQGKTLQQIADKLNQYGKRTQTGKLYTKGQIHRIIKMFVA